MSARMTEERFIELLQAYGADLARWPETERTAGEALLLGAGHRLRDFFESERAFDAILAEESGPPPSPVLGRRALAHFSQPPARRKELFRLQPRWAVGWALAASMAVGVAIGFAGEPATGPNSDYDQMLALSGAGTGAVFFAALSETDP